MVWWHHLVHTQVRNPESQCGQPQPRFSGGSSSACCAALAMAFSTKASAHFAIPICKAQVESVAKIILSVATPEEQKPFESGQWRYTSDHIRFIQFLPQNSNAIFSRPVTAVTKFIRPIETTTRIGRKNTTKKGCSRWAAAAQVVGFKECQRHSFLEIYARAQITSI